MSFVDDIADYKTAIDFTESFEKIAFPKALWDVSPYKSFDVTTCDTSTLEDLTFTLKDEAAIFTIPVEELVTPAQDGDSCILNVQEAISADAKEGMEIFLGSKFFQLFHTEFKPRNGTTNASVTFVRGKYGPASATLKVPADDPIDDPTDDPTDDPNNNDFALGSVAPMIALVASALTALAF